MKRFLFITVFVAMTLVVLAKAPNLNVEKLFEDPYKTNKSVSIQISKSHNKYYRGFTVRGNAKLVKQVEKFYDQDSKSASTSQEMIEAGERKFSSMKIENNGETINIGLSYEGKDGCYLFITGPLAAFE